MPCKKGDHHGGIRTLEDLRLRCYCDGQCWHLRSARGKKMPTDQLHKLHLFGIGQVTATRGAWLLSTGKMPLDGYCVVRVCDSYDCVNPGHLRHWTPTKWGEWLSKTGRSRTTAKTIAAKKTGLARSKLTPEQRQTILRAASAAEAARAVGIASSYAISIRARHRLPNSFVFASYAEAA